MNTFSGAVLVGGDFNDGPPSTVTAPFERLDVLSGRDAFFTLTTSDPNTDGNLRCSDSNIDHVFIRDVSPIHTGGGYGAVTFEARCFVPPGMVDGHYTTKSDHRLCSCGSGS